MGIEAESQRSDDSRSEVFITQPSKSLTVPTQMALINQNVTVSIEACRRSPKC